MAVVYNVAAFLCALVVLERAADLFVENTAAVAKALGVPQGLVALLTAGAEWEEVRCFQRSLRPMPHVYFPACGHLRGTC